jgi:hypothetical protein
MARILLCRPASRQSATLTSVRRVVMIAVVLACAVVAPGASAAPRCAPLLSPRTLPAIRALDPRPGAPRVFAIQYRQAAVNVTSYASFAATVDCVMRRWVVPNLARGRPNVVVFDEDTGLATLGIGARGAAARLLFNRASGPDCTPDCALGSLSVLARSYAGPLLRYAARFRGLGTDPGVFLSATDTIARSFLATMSAAARRYGVYLIASGDLPAFRASTSPADIRAFADPAVRHPTEAYVATSSQVHNQAFIWGPRNVRSTGPDVLRNVVASNLKVPLTPIEQAIGLTPGPSAGAAATRNLHPYPLPGTKARLGIATSAPAFVYGSPPAGTNPCSDTATYYMRCLDRLGANVVIQDEANPGAWTGADGNGIEQWQPLSWMASTYRAVSDRSVHFAYNVTAMMVGNLADLVFDGQSAITQRGGLRGPGCHYIGDRSFVSGEDQAQFRGYAGTQHDFLALAPWVSADGSRASLRATGRQLAAGSGSSRVDRYLETAIVADLPLPVDPRRQGCVGQLH